LTLKELNMTRTGVFLCATIVGSAIIAIFVASAKAPAASPPASQPARAATVKIDNFTFQPKILEIAPGTTVTWQNNDDVPHTASSTASPPAFDSGALDTDDTFSFTFAAPGTYPYFCKVHPHMTGMVVVK
jgi:plastocyanin